MKNLLMLASLAVATSSPATAPAWGQCIEWTEPQPLNVDAAFDDADDELPSVRRNGRDGWLAVWSTDKSFDAPLGSDADLVVSTSDDGSTWTAPVPLNADAGTDSRSDGEYTLATDERGNAVVVWYRFQPKQLFFSRSSDNGTSWTAPAPFAPDTTPDPACGGDEQIQSRPVIETDGEGTWHVVWAVQYDDRSLRPCIDSPVNSFFVYLSSSEDDGATWSAPQIVSRIPAQGQSTPFYRDYQLVQIDDRAWAIIWGIAETGVGSSAIGSNEIQVTRSFDNGQTWSTPKTAWVYPSDSALEAPPRDVDVASDAQGTLIASLGTPFNRCERQVLGDVTQSFDGGESWTEEGQQPGIKDPSDMRIATDGRGVWVVSRVSNAFAGSLEYRSSHDNGATWSDPRPLDASALDGPSLWSARLVQDLVAGSDRTWMAVWTSVRAPASGDTSSSGEIGPYGDDRDIYFSLGTTSTACTLPPDPDEGFVCVTLDDPFTPFNPGEESPIPQDELDADIDEFFQNNFPPFQMPSICGVGMIAVFPMAFPFLVVRRHHFPM